jgi:hypothetical protein
MALSEADHDLHVRKRRLRLELGRVRRRIDRRVRGSQRRARERADWRTYARRYPGNLLLGAFGLGLALSAGLNARRLSRWLGVRLFRRALHEGEKRLGRELARLWTERRETGSRTPMPETATNRDARR